MPTFLSCLRGSELEYTLTTDLGTFLSCLRGSEHEESDAASSTVFLSCLRGSEPFKITRTGLIVKAFFRYFAKNPFFKKKNNLLQVNAL